MKGVKNILCHINDTFQPGIVILVNLHIHNLYIMHINLHVMKYTEYLHTNLHMHNVYRIHINLHTHKIYRMHINLHIHNKHKLTHT